MVEGNDLRRHCERCKSGGIVQGSVVQQHSGHGRCCCWGASCSRGCYACAGSCAQETTSQVRGRKRGRGDSLRSGQRVAKRDTFERGLPRVGFWQSELGWKGRGHSWQRQGRQVGRSRPGGPPPSGHLSRPGCGVLEGSGVSRQASPFAEISVTETYRVRTVVVPLRGNS